MRRLIEESAPREPAASGEGLLLDAVLEVPTEPGGEAPAAADEPAPGGPAASGEGLLLDAVPAEPSAGATKAPPASPRLASFESAGVPMPPSSPSTAPSGRSLGSVLPPMTSYPSPSDLTPPPARPFSAPGALDGKSLGNPDPDDATDDAALAEPNTVAEAAASIGELLRAVAADRTAQVRGGGPTIEDVVREQVRLLVKDWLDRRLTALVERVVRAEIERVIARSVG
jgi:uncharacterized protein